MNEKIPIDEIEYKGYLINLHMILDDKVVLYYASVMELNYVFSGFDVNICVQNAKKRIDKVNINSIKEGIKFSFGEY
jgi:hypothetical protein